MGFGDENEEIRTSPWKVQPDFDDVPDAPDGDFPTMLPKGCLKPAWISSCNKHRKTQRSVVEIWYPPNRMIHTQTILPGRNSKGFFRQGTSTWIKSQAAH